MTNWTPHGEDADKPGLEHWTALATRVLHTAGAAIVMLDGEREHIVASSGAPGDDRDAGLVPAWRAICRSAVGDDTPLAVEDTRDTPSPSVAALARRGVRACLAVRVCDAAGTAVGAFCVLGREPREWSGEDPAILAELARAVERQLATELELRDHQRLLNVLEGQHRIHDLLAAEAPLPEVLDELVLGVESQSDGMRGSVLLLDPVARRLRHGAAPSLPDAYCAGIDGVEIGSEVGSCGSAAYSAEEVFVDDIATDHRWRDHRDFAMAHGLRACWSVPVLDADGEVLATFGLYYGCRRSPLPGEITLIRNASRLAGIAIQRHRTRERLIRLATHDPLTGLPNGVLLHDRLDRMLAARARPRTGVAALFCDINGLKLINDSLGHESGDVVLAVIAARLEKCVRGEDTVARLGGDQFVVGVTGMSAAALSRLADRLVRALGAPIDASEESGVARTVSVTIGIARSGVATSPEDLVRRSEVGMQQAKRAGTPWSFHAEGGEPLAVDELRLHSALHGALERGELSLAYQPIFDVSEGHVVSVEALLRWAHPELGRVGPDRFIPIAERHGLIAPIGDWVMRRAAEQGVAWNVAAPRPIVLAVNVSPRQLIDPAFAERVEAILQDTGLAPELLSIEITETALMADDVPTVNNLQRLNELGVGLSLDDFGTGYSSLSHLRRLPISALKIDRSFVDGLATDADDGAIVSGVIGMARGLDVAIVAEGVETQEQAEVLRDLCCDYVQGFLYARPLAAHAATALLDRERVKGPGPRARADGQIRASVAR